MTAIVSAVIGFLFAFIIFKLKQKENYITAILESRLNAAQEAYDKALYIKDSIHKDEEIKSAIRNDFSDWYRNNSLKLPLEIRKTINIGMNHVTYYNTLLETYKITRREGDKSKDKADEYYNELNANFEFIKKMPSKIESISDKLFNQYINSEPKGFWGSLKEVFFT